MSDPYGRHRAVPPPPPATVPVATVSVLDVFARVVEMQVQLGAINEKLQDLPDHETRIRLLERFRYTLAGFAVFAGGISGYLGYLIGRH